MTPKQIKELRLLYTHAHQVNKCLEEIEKLQSELDIVTDLIDDILYRTENDEVASGDAVYLVDGPIVEEFLPQLRKWFVDHVKAVRAANPDPHL